MSAPSPSHVRVWVEDVWDTVSLVVAPEWTVARLKEAALHQALAVHPDPDRYEVKRGGALVLNEQITLRELDVPDNASFIVLSTRRRPVR